MMYDDFLKEQLCIMISYCMGHNDSGSPSVDMLTKYSVWDLQCIASHEISQLFVSRSIPDEVKEYIFEEYKAVMLQASQYRFDQLSKE